MDEYEELERALIADGEKLRALTGEDHRPWVAGDTMVYGGNGTWVPNRQAAQDDLAALRGQLATALADAAHWKANHAEMVQRNAVLRERTDLPADRLPSIARYEAQLATMRKALEPFAEAADSLDANDDYSSASIWEHPCALDITIGDLRRARAALAPQVQV